MNVKIAYTALILLLACAVLSGATTAQSDSCDDRVIHVSGTGQVTADPDQAIISLAVETEHSDVQKGQEENAARMTTVINALKNAGLTSDDLKTTGYSIYPVWNDETISSKTPWDQNVKYYRVTNTLLVTLDDIDRVGEIIDLAVASGADRVNYISFTLSDERREELRSDALIAAVDQAQTDAQIVADAMGLTIMGVKEVNVGAGSIPYRYDYAPVAEAVAVEGISTPIEPGTVDVTATVSITYLIG